MRDLRRRGLLTDLVIVGVVLGWTLLMIANGGLGTPDPRSRGLDPLGVMLSCVSAVPLLARRRAPGITYAVTAGATALLLLLRYPVDLPAGAGVAAYAVATVYSGHPDRARRRWALLAVVGFVPVVTAIYAVTGVRVVSILPELLAWLAIFVGIWLAGDRNRLRREQFEHLRERVALAEHDAEQQRQLAAAQERTRIARELHDSAGHAINVILVQAGAARLLHERDPQASRAAIGTIEQVARDTIDEIDRMVRALREDTTAEPPPADPRAWEELIARHRATGLALAADLDAPRRPLPPSVAWATYRILQESLTNAARHGCGEAAVTVRFDPTAVEINVTNPTPSPDHALPTSGGHGIIGMRERASLLGGTLETTDQAGTFRLRARLPLTGAAV